MNTSTYFIYDNHVNYKFRNQAQSIGIEPTKIYPIDIQNLICINHNCSKIIVSNNMPHSTPSSIEYANLINRHDIFQPSYRIANFRNATITKNSRQGFSKINNNLTSSHKRTTISIGTNIIYDQTS
jgi:hypothetical protein